MTRYQTKFFRIPARLWAGLLLVLWALLLGISVQADAAERQRRNPFSLPRGIHYWSAEVAPPPAVLLPGIPLVLQAVVWGGPERVAIINGQNYVVGDQAFGQEVLSIAPEKVVLEGIVKDTVLRLNRPNFSIRVSPGY